MRSFVFVYVLVGVSACVFACVYESMRERKEAIDKICICYLVNAHRFLSGSKSLIM